LKRQFKQTIWVFVTLISHYRRHPGQALTMALGLISGVALWAAVQLINDHARSSYAEADQLLGAEARYWIRSDNGLGVAVADYVDLRRAGFEQLYPVIETQVRDAEGRSVAIIATDLLALPVGSGIGSNARYSNPFGASSWLALIQADYQAWYPQSLATQLGSAMRFFLTRLYDWLHTPKDALVSPKDPMEYWSILRFHQSVSGVGAYGFD